MQFVTEEVIDAMISSFENEDDAYDQALLEFTTAQPGITNYLLSEEFDSLTDDEKEVMLYMCIIIYNSIKNFHPEMPTLTVDEIEDAEDANWGLLENISEKKFRDRMNVFFNETPQEDLLAFIEDVLLEEEEIITKEGREPIFVALKSITDCFQAEL